MQVAKSLFDMGCYEVSLGGTIGVGTPGKMSLVSNKVATLFMCYIHVPVDRDLKFNSINSTLTNL